MLLPFWWKLLIYPQFGNRIGIYCPVGTKLKKEQYGKYNSFKYFTGYNDNDVIRPLYLGFSQMTGYVNKFDKNKNKNKKQ